MNQVDWYPGRVKMRLLEMHQSSWTDTVQSWSTRDSMDRW
jgi:hypothetical protein